VLAIEQPHLDVGCQAQRGGGTMVAIAWLERTTYVGGRWSPSRFPQMNGYLSCIGTLSPNENRNVETSGARAVQDDDRATPKTCRGCVCMCSRILLSSLRAKYTSRRSVTTGTATRVA
jgi:hypothetical protein